MGAILVAGKLQTPRGRDMKTMLLCFSVASTVGVLAVTSPAHAATETYVSGLGSGVTCSRAAPCADFQTAHNATDPGGAVFCLDKVVQTGTLTITKSIEINCRDFHGEIIAPSGGHGVDIATAGVNVSLRGLDIYGAAGGVGGIGVNFTDGSILNISFCRIFNFRGNGGGPGIGLLFAPQSGTGLMFVHDAATNHNGLAASGGGIIVQPSGSASARVTIDYARVEHNTFGVFANGSGTTGQISVQIINSIVSTNVMHGISSFTSSGITSTTLNNTSSHLNGGSGILAQGANAFVTLEHARVTSNNTGLSTPGGHIFSYGDNHLSGNVVDGSVSALLPLR